MSDAEKPPGSTDELGLVKIHLVAGICWLVVGMLFGTFMGYRLSGAGASEWLGNYEFLSFGRIRMGHTHIVVYGWLVNGLTAFSYYAVPRLTGKRLMLRKLVLVNAFLYQVAVLVGLGALIAGQAEGVEYTEAPWYADILIAGCFVISVASIIGTILTSNVRAMYVSLWYIILAFIFTTLNYVMSNTIVAHVAPGAAGAALEGLWIHNLVGLFVTPLGAAIVYYMLPVIVKRPIASHKLSLIGFWTLAFFYPLGGSHHFFYSPTPWWLQVIAVPLTFALIFVVYTVVYNFFATMKGQWKLIAKSIPLRFLAFGIINYIIMNQGSRMQQFN